MRSIDVKYSPTWPQRLAKEFVAAMTPQCLVIGKDM